MLIEFEWGVKWQRGDGKVCDKRKVIDSVMNLFEDEFNVQIQYNEWSCEEKNKPNCINCLDITVYASSWWTGSGGGGGGDNGHTIKWK